MSYPTTITPLVSCLILLAILGFSPASALAVLTGDPYQDEQQNFEAGVQAERMRTVGLKMTPSRPNPRYYLWDGVDKAIDAMHSSSEPFTLVNVMKELERMDCANDIRLPYHYLKSYKVSWETNLKTGKRTKETSSSRARLPREEALKKLEFAKEVCNRMRKIDPAVVFNRSELVDFPPEPMEFGEKKSFVDAYVQYAKSHITDDEKATYGKKLGGMNTFAFDKKREAESIWKSMKGK